MALTCYYVLVVVEISIVASLFHVTHTSEFIVLFAACTAHNQCHGVKYLLLVSKLKRNENGPPLQGPSLDRQRNNFD